MLCGNLSFLKSVDEFAICSFYFLIVRPLDRVPSCRLGNSLIPQSCPMYSRSTQTISPAPVYSAQSSRAILSQPAWSRSPSYSHPSSIILSCMLTICSIIQCSTITICSHPPISHSLPHANNGKEHVWQEDRGEQSDVAMLMQDPDWQPSTLPCPDLFWALAKEEAIACSPSYLVPVILGGGKLPSWVKWFPGSETLHGGRQPIPCVVVRV